MTTELNIINVTRRQQLMFVLKEIKKIQMDPILNKTTKFIIDETNITKFIVLINPNEGMYMGIIISFELTVPTEYPAPGHPIKVKCLDSIYHPNIYLNGNLCLKYDGVGNLETGFKETLENLIVAINYLFVHPNNTGFDGIDMNINMQNTIKKNIDQYRLRTKLDKIPKKDTDRLYKSREIYCDTINPTLLKINNWISYFPKECIVDSKKNRCYVFTLGGRKLMDLAKLEDVISNIIHDPRIIFETAPNIAYVIDEIDRRTLLAPLTPFTVVLTKFKRINYPDNIYWDSRNNCFNTQITFEQVIKLCIPNLFVVNIHMMIMCNVMIRSNYKFAFTCQNQNENNNIPIMTSSEIMINGIKEYVMNIDQYICSFKSILNDNYLILEVSNEENLFINSSNSFFDPNKPLWFFTSFSVMILGTDLLEMFTNVAYKLNPTDKNSPYITNSSNGTRQVTSAELNLIHNNTDDIVNSIDDYYDIELATKYLAATSEQTGLDLSAINLLN